MKLTVKAYVKRISNISHKVQFFSFYPTRFDASDVIENPGSLKAYLEDWDYMLVLDEGVETGYTNKETRWSTIDTGYNGWGLVFVSPGNHDYSEYPQLKHLAR